MPNLVLLPLSSKFILQYLLCVRDWTFLLNNEHHVKLCQEHWGPLYERGLLFLVLVAVLASVCSCCMTVCGVGVLEHPLMLCPSHTPTAQTLRNLTVQPRPGDHFLIVLSSLVLTIMSQLPWSACLTVLAHLWLGGLFLLAQQLWTSFGSGQPANLSNTRETITYVTTHFSMRSEPQPWGDIPLPMLSFFAHLPLALEYSSEFSVYFYSCSLVIPSWYF